MLTFNHIDPAKPTLVLIDTSVALHRFDQSLAGIDHKVDNFLPLLKANMVAMANCSWLPALALETVAGVIFTVDTKQDFKYWRHDYLLDPANYLKVPRKLKNKERLRMESLERWAGTGTVSEEAHKLLAIHYKAGRSLPDYRFKKIRQNTLSWLSSPEQPLGASGIGLPYYESDDLMAAVVALNRAAGHPYNLIIYTVDSDLMGLIDPSVTWVCMTGFAPGIRDTLESCNRWSNTPDTKGRVKLGHLGTWRDVWVHKGLKGDKCDNIPASAGVLLPVIDLIDPPPAHKLSERPDIKAAINHLISSATPPNPSEASRAVRYMINSGCLPCFKSYTDVAVEKTLYKLAA